MISRVAESCFWLNRHMERVESHARFLGVNQSFVLDVDLAETERWRPLIVILGEEAQFTKSQGAALLDDGEAVQQYLTWSEETGSSIWSAVFWARENARTIRETVSLEMWETINALWLWLNSKPAQQLFRGDRSEFYAQVRDYAIRYQGHALSTVLHGESFDFMRLGTALERAGLTVRAIDMKYHTLGVTKPGVEMPDESAQWMAVLRFCSGIEPFAKRRGTELSGMAVAEFLLFDPQFPRSVRHNLERAHNFLNRIRGSGKRARGVDSAQALQRVLGSVRKLTVQQVMEKGIHRQLTELVGQTADVCMFIHQDFFDPPVNRRSGQA